MTSAEIRAIADAGTDRQVADLYKLLFGRSITGCKPCQKVDARIELRIMAKKKAATEQAGRYQVNPEYANVTIGGRVVSVDSDEDIAFWLKRFPKAIVEVKPEPVKEDEQD